MISDYFVCVGAQKASTTWLLATLGRHPAIFATPVKEIHYFDHMAGLSQHLSQRKRRARFRKYLQRLAFDWGRFSGHRSQWSWWQNYLRNPIDDAWYEALLTDRGTARLAGEATPEYAVLGESGYRHIARLAPDARAIFIMRSPLRQAWSQFVHFLHNSDDRSVKGGLSGAVAFWESSYSAAFRDYGRTIDELVAVFGVDRTKFLFHEDIHADRAGALRGICGFLEVDFQLAFFGDFAKPLNVSRPMPVAAELRGYLADMQRPVAEAVRERIGRVPDLWRQDVA